MTMKKMMMAAFCAATMPVAMAQATSNYSSSHRSGPYNTDLFDQVKDKIVIVRGPLGVGSGVFLRMDDDVWLVTNEHITRCGNPLRATTVTGKAVALPTNTTFQVAANRDLARIKVSDSWPALSIRQTAPNLGDAIWVFGNSDGGGVLTHITGRINGVGDNEIEVDAAFVSGNSGSAIMDKNGDVIALATYATRWNDPSDWVKSGTRFNDIRRFGVRFNSVAWEAVNWKTYSQQAYLFHACEAYKKFLIPICFGDKDLVTDYNVRESGIASRNVQYGKALSQLVKQDNKLKAARKALQAVLDKRERTPSGAIDYPSDNTLALRKNACYRESLKCYYERNCALRTGRDFMRDRKWCAQRLRDDAASLFEGFAYCVRIYNENNSTFLNEYKKEFFKAGLTFE